MPQHNMSVAERICALKQIFAEFGIPVANNSLLDQAITSEFGRGKRSPLTATLEDMQHNGEAAELAECIGKCLEKCSDEPELVNLGSVLRQRMPSLMQIVDVREQTARRIENLQHILQHFANKLSSQQEQSDSPEQIERLLRMLDSAQQRLKAILEVQALGSIVENTGIVLQRSELSRYARIFSQVTPALVAIDQPNTLIEQKVELCVQALVGISRELNDPKISKAVRIIDDVHWLAKITLPPIANTATIEQALQNLDLPLGAATTERLRKKALQTGLNEQEVIQLLYANKSCSSLDTKDQELLAATKQNKQYAAACGMLTKLGQDIECRELQDLGVAGICVVSLRQTYYEYKTSNLSAVTMSESLGIMLVGVGALTRNPKLQKIGNCVLDGVKAYTGLLALPGGPIIAVPLAVCSVLGKMILAKKHTANNAALPSVETFLQHLISQVVRLQLEMRHHFAQLYTLLEQQHQQVLLMLDQGFASLSNCIQYNSSTNLLAFKKIDNKLDNMQLYLGREFTDLYLEYIRDPMEEIEFFERFGQAEERCIQSNKLKLSMWLLYKAKHSKVNGRDLILHREQSSDLASYVALILGKINDFDSVLGLINRYVNLQFATNLPEELPHIPTWLLAANSYVSLVTKHDSLIADLDKETSVIHGIIDVGTQILDFVQKISQNVELEQKLNQAVAEQLKLVQSELNSTTEQSSRACLSSYAQICSEALIKAQGRVSSAKPSAMQMERFDPIDLDLSMVWQECFVQHIPIEFFLAQDYGFGELQLNYSIDPEVNMFANVRLNVSGSLLPDMARDVIYRIDVNFKTADNPKTQLLLSSWFAYDLGTIADRFNNYYQPKFKHLLKHSCYEWISLNGMRNQVQGHAESDTHKPIDYSALANLYQKWWLHSKAVNESDVLSRMLHNPSFYNLHKNMLDNGQNYEMYGHDMLLLQYKLKRQICEKLQQQRMQISVGLQTSKIAQQALAKLDSLLAIASVFNQLLLLSNHTRAVSIRFNELIEIMREDCDQNVDLNAEFNKLLVVMPFRLDQPDYQQVTLYQKVRQAMSRLELLAINCSAAVRFSL